MSMARCPRRGNTFRGAPTSLAMSAETFRLLPMHSTAGPVRHSGGEHRRKCLPTNYTRVHDTVLRRPVESALTARVAVRDQPAQAAGAVQGASEERMLYGVENQVGGHRPGGPPAHDPATVSVDDKRHVDEPHPGRHIGEVGHPKPIWRTRIEP